MSEIPRRDSMDALRAAVDGVAAISALGFARALSDGTVSVLYWYAHGFGEWVLTSDLLPDPVLPSHDGFAQIDRALLEAQRTRAVQAFPWP
jgi:hypothetical protein